MILINHRCRSNGVQQQQDTQRTKVHPFGGRRAEPVVGDRLPPGPGRAARARMTGWRTHAEARCLPSPVTLHGRISPPPIARWQDGVKGVPVAKGNLHATGALAACPMQELWFAGRLAG